MRPRAAIRIALVSAAEQIAPMPLGPGATWRDLGEQLQRQGLVNLSAPSEARLVRRTVVNMVQAGELARVGDRPVAGSRRPMAAYARRPRSGWMSGASGSELAAAWSGLGSGA
jgi:hypothetical protein